MKRSSSDFTLGGKEHGERDGWGIKEGVKGLAGSAGGGLGSRPFLLFLLHVGASFTSLFEGFNSGFFFFLLMVPSSFLQKRRFPFC